MVDPNTLRIKNTYHEVRRVFGLVEKDKPLTPKEELRGIVSFYQLYLDLLTKGILTYYNEYFVSRRDTRSGVFKSIDGGGYVIQVDIHTSTNKESYQVFCPISQEPIITMAREDWRNWFTSFFLHSKDYARLFNDIILPFESYLREQAYEECQGELSEGDFGPYMEAWQKTALKVILQLIHLEDDVLDFICIDNEDLANRIEREESDAPLNLWVTLADDTKLHVCSYYLPFEIEVDLSNELAVTLQIEAMIDNKLAYEGKYSLTNLLGSYHSIPESLASLIRGVVRGASEKVILEIINKSINNPTGENKNVT